MKQKNLWENILIIFIAFAIVILVIFLIKQVKEVEFWKTSFSKKTTHDSLEKNILILGTADLPNETSLLTDAIMLVNINLQQQAVRVVSIPRDLLVKMPGIDYFIKINSLLAVENRRGKVEKTTTIKEKMEEITNLKIDNIAVVDLDGFKYFIDAIGGVNIYLEETLYDPILTNPDNFDEMFTLKSGWNFLDGERAAKFIRSRHAPTGDFYRINHQHDLLMSVFQKLKQMNAFSDPSLINKIYHSWKGYLYTDFNLSDALTFLPLAKNLTLENISFTSISFSSPDPLLMSESSEIYGYYLKPILGLENYQAIQKHIHNFIN